VAPQAGQGSKAILTAPTRSGTPRETVAGIVQRGGRPRHFIIARFDADASGARGEGVVPTPHIAHGIHLELVLTAE